MTNRITITVSGPTGSGKTFILAAIESMLGHCGLSSDNLEWKDPHHKDLLEAHEDFAPDPDTTFLLEEINVRRGLYESGLQEIPITDAKRIAEERGYDQIVIIGRKVGEGDEPYGEHVTTYGVDKTHCDIAAKMGNYLKYDIMQWPREEGEL